jgi:phosphonate transport system permease protein
MAARTGRERVLHVSASSIGAYSAAPARLRALADGYASAVRAKRQRIYLGGALAVACTLAASVAGEVDVAKLASNIWRFPNYLSNLIPSISWSTLNIDLAEWFWGWKYWLGLLGETLLIAYLGTFLGAVGAFLLAFFAASNVSPGPTTRFLSRRYLELCRTVPEIVFALIFVIAFGLGPVPGVLALAIHTLGALGKLFAEVIENIDMKPVEGVTAAGASWSQVMRMAAVPQVLSSFASYTLLRFEINVRGAAIMGFVGAGGIGQELITAIRKFYYTDISAMLVLIIATVMVIDVLTERLRHHLIGLEDKP